MTKLIYLNKKNHSFRGEMFLFWKLDRFFQMSAVFSSTWTTYVFLKYMKDSVLNLLGTTLQQSDKLSTAFSPNHYAGEAN